MRSQRRGHRNKGAALVETTLLLPLFLIFWFGIVDWGLTFFVHQTIVHRANTAARWGVVNGWDPGAVRNLIVHGDVSGAGIGIFDLSAEPPDGSTGQNVDVELFCTTNLSPSLQTGAECLKAQWADHRWIQVTVHGYGWTHFTPFFTGAYTGRPIIVSLPAESLGAS
jgi:hypothetical protein